MSQESKTQGSRDDSFRPPVDEALSRQAIEATADKMQEETFAELQKSDRMFQAVFEQAAIGIAQLNIDGQFLRVNEYLCRMLGYTREELQEKNFADITHPDDLGFNREHIADVLAGSKESYDIEKRYLHKDGHPVWVRVLSKLIRNEKREPDFAVSMIADISEQREARQALAESEARYRFLSESIHDVVYALDAAGNLSYIGPQIERYGFERNTLLGETPMKWIVPEDRERMSAQLIKTFQGESDSTPFTFRILLPDGSYRWMEETGEPQQDDSGKVTGLTGVLRDITELRRAQENYESLFRTMSSPFALHEIICDSEGKPVDYRYLAVNPAFEEKTGLAADQIIGKTARALFPETEHHWIERFGEVAATGKATVFENYSAAFNRYFEITAYRPAPMQCACVFSDVTEAKQARKRKEELTKRLAEASRRDALGVMAGGVAHDLNNILGPIVLLPELIDEVLANAANASEEDIKGAREELAIMADSARRAARTIGDLKSMSRDVSRDLQPLDLQAFIHELLTTFEIQSLREQHPGVLFDARVSSEGAVIQANRTALHRAVFNIVLNAMDAVSDHGRVLLEVATAHFDEDKLGYELVPRGTYGVIHIRNTGKAITDDIFRNMFEPFVTNKKDQGHGGSGLGLSVVYAVMQDHQGYIDVARDEGEWSTSFSLYFPLDTSSIVVKSSAAGPDGMPRGSGHILVVDDEAGQRFVARRSLQRLGYTVTEAANGSEALSLFQAPGKPGAEGHAAGPAPGTRCPFDLILLDMVMPNGPDGLETLKRIREICPCQRVVICSGHVSQDRMRDAKEMNTSWLAKPYTQMEVAQAVAAAMHHEGG